MYRVAVAWLLLGVLPISMWFDLGGMDLTSCVFITRICAAQLGKIPIWKTTNKHVMWNPKNSFYIKTWKKINKKDWLTLHSAALMFTFVICDNRGKRAARARGGNSIRWRELFNKQKHPIWDDSQETPLMLLLLLCLGGDAESRQKMVNCACKSVSSYYIYSLPVDI